MLLKTSTQHLLNHNLGYFQRQTVLQTALFFAMVVCKGLKGLFIEKHGRKRTFQLYSEEDGKKVTAHKGDVRLLCNSQCLLFDIYGRLFCTVL